MTATNDKPESRPQNRTPQNPPRPSQPSAVGGPVPNRAGERPAGHGLAEWLAIALVAVALTAGWALKAHAENRVVRYQAQGVAVSYPAGWLPSQAEDGSLRFRDTRAGGAPATITLRPAAAADPEGAARAVAAEAESLTLANTQEWTAYRVLSSEANAPFRGQPARRLSYVFVHENPSAFQQHLPTVMLGENLVTYQQGRVYIFSLQAPQDEFARAQRRFQAFLGSVTFGSE